MKKLAATLITLTAIWTAVKVALKKNNKSSITVTNNQDELLADISDDDIIFHEQVKVYLNGKLVN